MSDASLCRYKPTARATNWGFNKHAMKIMKCLVHPGSNLVDPHNSESRSVVSDMSERRKEILRISAEVLLQRRILSAQSFLWKCRDIKRIQLASFVSGQKKHVESIRILVITSSMIHQRSSRYNPFSLFSGSKDKSKTTKTT